MGKNTQHSWHQSRKYVWEKYPASTKRSLEISRGKTPRFYWKSKEICWGKVPSFYKTNLGNMWKKIPSFYEAKIGNKMWKISSIFEKKLANMLGKNTQLLWNEAQKQAGEKYPDSMKPNLEISWGKLASLGIRWGISPSMEPILENNLGKNTHLLRNKAWKQTGEKHPAWIIARKNTQIPRNENTYPMKTLSWPIGTPLHPIPTPSHKANS